MKITIQHYNEIASLEVPDDSPLEDFRDHLLRILHVIWLPENVAEIMRANDWDEGFDAGKEEGFDKGREYGYKEGFAKSDKCLPTPAIKELLRDKERLDWVLSDAGKYWLSLREDIDKEMEESK